MRMNIDEFRVIVNDRVQRSLAVLTSKGQRYAANEDVLHNFRVAAMLEHSTMVKALTGMMTKHTVKLHDMLADSDKVTFSSADWDEVIGDSINYLLILTAVLEEEYGTLPQDRLVMPIYDKDKLALNDPIPDWMANRQTLRNDSVNINERVKP